MDITYLIALIFPPPPLPTTHTHALLHRMAQRWESSFAYSSQLHIGYVNTGGHVSDDLSSGTNDPENNSAGTGFFPRIKLEWID